MWVAAHVGIISTKKSCKSRRADTALRGCEPKYMYFDQWFTFIAGTDWGQMEHCESKEKRSVGCLWRPMQLARRRGRPLIRITYIRVDVSSSVPSLGGALRFPSISGHYFFPCPLPFEAWRHIEICTLRREPHRGRNDMYYSLEYKLSAAIFSRTGSRKTSQKILKKKKTKIEWEKIVCQ